MRRSVCAVLLLLLVWPAALPARAAAPPSPAQLNIRPVHEGLWLPDTYVPKDFRVDSAPVAFNRAAPPRNTGNSQRFIREVPLPSLGGKTSRESNIDDWVSVFLSNMRVYPTAQDAKGYFDYTVHFRSAARKADIGDEAFFKPWEESPWKGNAKLHDKTHEWDYRRTSGVVRVGRVVFEISLQGSLKTDRLDADTGKGFTSFQGMVTIRETPSRDELDAVMGQFAAGVRAYAGDMGWAKDAPAQAGASGKGSPATVPPAAAAPSEPAGAEAAPPSAGDASTPVSPGQAAGATAAAGALAVMGSLMFGRAMGVDLTSLREALELLRGAGGSPSAAAPAPMPAPELHNDGDVNAAGEVWSENSGWVSQADYARDLATRRLIREVNAGANARPDDVAQDLGRALSNSRQQLDEMRQTGRYVDLCTGLAERFGSAEERAWCLDFIHRHAQAGPDGYAIDPETARQMYAGLKKQMAEAGQIAHAAEAAYQAAVADELGQKSALAAQIRDNATRVNRVLAKFDPTGTGGKIVGFQQGVYGAIDGYEQGGVAGAAEAAALSLADNCTQGYASGNYRAAKEAWAESGLSDTSLGERLARANLETANSKYNVFDHVGKAADHLLEGEFGAAVDSTLDAFDAKDSLKEDYGKARDWATGAKAEAADQPLAPPDTPPDAGGKPLGSLRRDSFEATRRSMDHEIQMMRELNRIAEIPDPARRQAELVRIRQADPSTFNVVQKQLHPDTAAAVTDTSRELSDRVVERQAQVLKEMGYEPGVRLTGKAGGADTDGYWTLRDGDGRVLSDAETRRFAGEALQKASDEVLGPLGTDADRMGHKIMNASPEKFAADPNDLGIRSRDGRIQDGRLVFEDHARRGGHWKASPREAALTAPEDRIAGAALTRDNAESLGTVMQTKTQHLDEIAHTRGAVTEADMRDLARELTKTDHRTFLPMAEKAGVKPTAEYRDLMQKLMLVKDGEISSRHLPPRGEIDRIIAENVGRLKEAIKEP